MVKLGFFSLLLVCGAWIKKDIFLGHPVFVHVLVFVFVSVSVFLRFQFPLPTESVPESLDLSNERRWCSIFNLYRSPQDSFAVTVSNKVGFHSGEAAVSIEVQRRKSQENTEKADNEE